MKTIVASNFREAITRAISSTAETPEASSSAPGASHVASITYPAPEGDVAHRPVSSFRIYSAFATNGELGVDPVQPLCRGAEPLDPLELLDDALRTPVDREHVERGGEHQGVVVEEWAELLRDLTQFDVVGLRQPGAKLAEAAHQWAAPRRKLGERLAPAHGREHFVGRVLPDHRLGHDRTQLAPCPLARRRALGGPAAIVIHVDRDHADAELVPHRGFASRASSPEHRPSSPRGYDDHRHASRTSHVTSAVERRA